MIDLRDNNKLDKQAMLQEYFNIVILKYSTHNKFKSVHTKSIGAKN